MRLIWRRFIYTKSETNEMYFNYLIDQIRHGVLCRSLSMGSGARGQCWSQAGLPPEGLNVVPHEKICVLFLSSKPAVKYYNIWQNMFGPELNMIVLWDFIYTGCEYPPSEFFHFNSILNIPYIYLDYLELFMPDPKTWKIGSSNWLILWKKKYGFKYWENGKW